MAKEELAVMVFSGKLTRKGLAPWAGVTRIAAGRAERSIARVAGWMVRGAGSKGATLAGSDATPEVPGEGFAAVSAVEESRRCEARDGCDSIAGTGFEAGGSGRRGAGVVVFSEELPA